MLRDPLAEFVDVGIPAEQPVGAGVATVVAHVNETALADSREKSLRSTRLSCLEPFVLSACTGNFGHAPVDVRIHPRAPPPWDRVSARFDQSGVAMTDQTILITGAAGGVGSLLRPRLSRPDRTLRLLDVAPIPAPTTREEIVVGSVTDADAMVDACRGVDTVVHLGGQRREHDIDNVVELNIKGTYVVLEAARRAGVRTVMLASSNHAVGFSHRDQVPGKHLPADTPARPDTLYGLSKVGIEAAGRLFHDRYGINVICARIGSWFETPPGVRGLATWLSPDDGARMVEACIAAEAPGFRFIWGISRNSRRWFSLAEGEAIGYDPQDDAELFADRLVTGDEPDFLADPELNRAGGSWCEVELGKPMT